MGFQIVDNVVVVDHDLNLHADTRTTNNPRSFMYDGITVHPVFYRMNDETRSSGSPGDNCPFIYALKQKDGLKVRYSGIKSLHKNFSTILGYIAGGGASYQYLVPIPSASSIASVLTERFRRVASNVTVEAGWLKKATIENALANADALNTKVVPSSDIRVLRSELNRQRKMNGAHSSYSSKRMPAGLRKHVQPLSLHGTDFPEDVNHITFVDDLISSGTSMLCARDLLREIYPGAVFSVVALFGPLHGKLRHR